MKNHIVFKFIAVALCALALMGMLLSAAGIAALVAHDLYSEGLPNWKSERIAYGADQVMQGLAGQYIFNTHYADFPEFVLEQTEIEYDLIQYLNYSNAQRLLRANHYFTIHDAQGHLLDGTLMGTDMTIPAGLTIFTLKNVTFPYQQILSIVDITDEVNFHNDVTTMPASVPTVSGVIQETVVSSTIPQEYDRCLRVHDWKNDTHYEVYCEQQVSEPLTVTLYLDEKTVVFEPELVAGWQFMELLHAHRFDLIWLLAGSALLFAILAVYLCCAAGKKPGTQEIKPAGFNALPLDLYAAGATGIIVAMIALIGEVVPYSSNFDITDVGKVTIIAAMGYAVCLVFVAFCFACAAQFKMPDGFFLRHSLSGIVLGFSFRYTGKVVRFLWETIPPLAKKTWAGLTSLSGKLYAITSGLCKELWKLLSQVCGFLWKHIRNFLQISFHGFSRFFSLLPMTWQWLLVGFAMFFLCILGFRTYSTGSFITVFICIGIILYGAHAFGILMEAAKRMGSGDLDTKVSDQFLLGSFKDFARHLNALADVAVVAAQKQMKSERMKTELITNVSHDIKTPLTSIINYVDLLQLPHSEEDEAAYLEVLGRKSQQLKKLIDDLMEMSKASTGNLTVDIRQVDAVETINQSLGEFSDKLAATPLSPVLTMPDSPVYMKADGRLAWRVMNNLLSNAVKYALPGTRLYIDLNQAGGKVLISLKNISREPLNVSADELMERFVRGDTSRNTEGSGLGLNIAKGLMEVQHGQLQLLVDGDLFKVTLVFPGIEEQR